MGRLNNRFDKDKVQQELDVQRQVSQDFSRNVQQAKVEINQKIDSLKQQRDSGQISEAEYQYQVGNWQRFSTGLSAVATGLAAPTDSALGITAAAANPVVSYHIGQHFKRNAELNKIDGGNRPEENSKEHRALHALNGIISAAAADNNALLGGIAAGGAEIIAPTLAKTLYGKEAKDLNADEKATVSSMTALFGAAVGAVSGNAAEVVSDSQLAQGAVDNNFSLNDLGFSENAARNMQYQANKEINNFTINKSSSQSDKNVLYALLKEYGANAAITTEINAALGFGANISASLNQNGELTITIAGTAGLGVSGFVGTSTSSATRKDGVFSEVCASAVAGAAAGSCIGANLSPNSPLIHSAKVGTGFGLSPIEANANIGYQKTFKLTK